MDIVPYLKLMVQKNGSDVFFSTGAAPHLKAEGETRPIGSSPLQPGQVRKLAYGIMSDEQIKEFDAYYIPTRYPDALPGTLPDGLPDQEDADSCTRLAEQTLAVVETQLGAPHPNPREARGPTDSPPDA